MFSSSVRCLYLMEIDLPGKVGLTCSKTCGNGSRIRVRLCNNRATAHEGEDCEGEGKKNQKIVWSVIVQLNLIFLGGRDGRHVRLSMMQCFISILINQFSLQKDISFDLVVLSF